MDLQTQLELTPKDADAIVKYRTDHGDFKDFDSLTKVPGVDVAKLTAKKDSIIFADAPPAASSHGGPGFACADRATSITFRS